MLDRLSKMHFLSLEELDAQVALTWALDEIVQLRSDLADRDQTIYGCSVLMAETTAEIDQLMWELEVDREALL